MPELKGQACKVNLRNGSETKQADFTAISALKHCALYREGVNDDEKKAE